MGIPNLPPTTRSPQSCGLAVWYRSRWIPCWSQRQTRWDPKADEWLFLVPLWLLPLCRKIAWSIVCAPAWRSRPSWCCWAPLRGKAKCTGCNSVREIPLLCSYYSNIIPCFPTIIALGRILPLHESPRPTAYSSTHEAPPCCTPILSPSGPSYCPRTWTSTLLSQRRTPVASI